MHEGKHLYTQLMEFLPRKLFRQCVQKHNGDAYCKTFSCHDHFLAMAFAQLTLREGLSGIRDTLNANSLYHLGFICKAIARNILAHANEVRSWKMYADLALKLMKRARKLYQNDPFSVDLNAAVFAVESTTIELCLGRFHWAYSQSSQAAVKMHVSLALQGNIPDFIVISDAHVS